MEGRDGKGSQRIKTFRVSELVRFGEFWRVQKQYPGKPGKADPSSDPREPDVTN